MDPHKFVALSHLHDSLCKYLVGFVVRLPQLLLVRIILKGVYAFKVVKKWSDHCFVKLIRLLEGSLIDEDGNTIVFS